MKDGLLAIGVCACIFVLVGIESTSLSSITPELTSYFNISPTYLELIYPASWAVSFIATVLLYAVLLRVRTLPFYVGIASALTVVQATCFIVALLLEQWIGEIGYLSLILISNVLFGFIMATFGVAVEMLLNNRFSYQQEYSNNGIWSLLLLFKLGGWIAGYFISPLLFTISVDLFTVALAGCTVGLILCGLIVVRHFRSDLVLAEKESKQAAVKRTDAGNNKSVALMLCGQNILCTGMWFSMLLFIPQNVSGFGFFTQDIIVISLTAGAVVSAAVWYCASSALYWFWSTLLSIIVTCAGMLLYAFASDSSPSLSTLGILLFCVGGGGFYSSPYVAAVNFFKNDWLRIALMMISTVVLAAVAVFSSVITLLLVLPSGKIVTSVVCTIAMLCSILFLDQIRDHLSTIPSGIFGKNVRAVLSIDVESQPSKFRHKPVNQDDHELEQGDNFSSVLENESNN